ncbi:hypothetical protein H5A26_22555, partial [Pectobacterium brasiliense]|nr:hypothetical protein [Pectobacterium brasiliense]
NALLSLGDNRNLGHSSTTSQVIVPRRLPLPLHRRYSLASCALHYWLVARWLCLQL